MSKVIEYEIAEVRTDSGEIRDKGNYGVDPTHRDFASSADIADGVTDASVAFTLADTYAQQYDLGLIVRPGEYVVATNLTLTSKVKMVPGAILKPANGVTITLAGGFEGDIYSQAFDHSDGGTVTISQTQDLRPEWWGAKSDGSTDDTTALQAALDSTVYSGRVLLRPSSDTAYYKTTAKLNLPVANGVALVGAGLRATRIRLTAAADAVVDTNTVWASSTNGMQIENVWLDANSVGTYGLKWVAANRFRLTNVRCTGATTAGFYFADSIVGTIMGCDADGNAVGMELTNGGNSGPNALAIIKCSIENNTSHGINFSNGGAGCLIAGCDIEGNNGHGLRLQQDAGGLEVTGCYFEENDHASNASSDIYIGTNSFCRGVSISGNYFNGRITGDYYPIRVGYASGLVIHEGNYLNIGSRWVYFDSNAANANGCTLYGPTYGSSFASTDPEDLYVDLPSSFVASRNRILDSLIVPKLAGNYISRDLPFSWSASIGAGGSFIHTGVVYRNQKNVTQLARGTGAALAYQAIAISASNNSELRGRYVTFVAPVYNDGTASTPQIELYVTFTSGASTVSKVFGGYAVADGWQRPALTFFVPANETGITIYYNLNSNNVGFYLGRPTLLVGVDMPDAAATEVPPDWASSAAPTTGTWAAGDIVYDVTPSASGNIGWVCVTAGTPGTWKAFGTIAT